MTGDLQKFTVPTSVRMREYSTIYPVEGGVIRKSRIVVRELIDGDALGEYLEIGPWVDENTSPNMRN